MKARPTIPLLMALVLTWAGSAGVRMFAGTIVGSVKAQGKESPGQEAGGGKYDSRKYKFAERVDYSAMHEFVVHLEGLKAAGSVPVTNASAVVTTTRRVTQKDASFSPHVLPVMVGTTVEWPNNDTIYHNVFSISDAKQFDLELYKAPDTKRVTFDKVGRVDVFCSIHKAMSCVVLVVENPYFSVTDDRGRYSLTNAPAGTHRLRAWHERLPSQTKEIVVPETGEVRVDFTLGISNLPKY